MKLKYAHVLALSIQKNVAQYPPLLLFLDIGIIFGLYEIDQWFDLPRIVTVFFSIPPTIATFYGIFYLYLCRLSKDD